MIITVDRNKLLTALQRLYSGIMSYAKASFHGRGYDACRCYIFRVSLYKMQIEVSDKEIFMSESVSIGNPDVGEIEFAVFAPQFIKAIKSLDSQELELSVLEYQIIVRHSTGSFALPLDDCVAMFDADVKEPMLGGKKPVFDLTKAETLTMEAPGLNSILTKCLYACADDSLRPVLNGVCMAMNDKYTDFVASDGHKLVRLRKHSITTNKPVRMVWPRKVVTTLLKILPKTGFVDLWLRIELVEATNEYQVLFARLLVEDGPEIFFKPIDGRYPNYESVIPTTHCIEFTADRKNLIKSVERISQFTNDSSGLIVFHLKDNSLTMTGEDKDFETKADETLPVKYGGNFLKMGFKDITVIKTLRNVVSNEITVKGKDSSQAFTFEPTVQPDNEEILMLLMPMLIND